MSKKRSVNSILESLRRKEKIDHQHLHSAIRELHETKESLAKDEALLRSILESTADGIIVIDNRKNVLHFNKQFAHIWNIPAKTKNKDISRTLHIAARLLKDPSSLLSHKGENQQSEYHIDRLNLRDGRIIERFSRPLIVHDKTIGRVWSFRDVTELENFRSDMERLVNEQTQELRVQNLEMVRSAIGLVEAKKSVEDQNIDSMDLAGHEMKTPLTSITSLIDLISQKKLGPLTDKQEESMKIVLEDAKRLNMIVKNMGDVARIEENRIVYDFTDFNLTELLKETINISEVMLQQRNVKAILETDEPITITADRTRLGQVILNLLTNSYKYGNENGHIWISARKEYGKILISVKDDGIGIAKENIPKLFTKRFQIDPKANRVLGGLGLGLYICKRIIERHLGDIFVKSKLNEGSTLTISLPILNKKFK
ncbi:PAS domain-containing sensor histidine kinase [Candidatus Pacearchaeota archaeon]|nr:PAS domain-containing sensor histidine kinase [Candidatus Pacearchaeota archaeon]